MRNAFFTNQPLLRGPMTAVAAMMEQRIQVPGDQLTSALQEMASRGGKFLRPALFWLFASLNGQPASGDHDRLVKIATSLEVLHLATLIHDDVIDDSATRRGQVAIQARFGKDVAVYSGDYLFTVFFDLLTATMIDSPYLQVNAHTMHRILTGELGQMADRFVLDQTIMSYLRNVNGKTAALFSLAASEGAHFGGSSRRTVARAKRIGQNIGISFQILDDILDYDRPEELNKPVLVDLTTGVYSLPLLLALRADSRNLSALLQKGRALTPTDLQKIRQLVIDLGGLAQARQVATRFTTKALDGLSQLPAGPARQLLIRVTDQLLKRQQ